MRLFVALELPAPLQTDLGRIGKSLDEHGSHARWVRPVAIHLTLKFLGEVDPSQVGLITDALMGVRANRLDLRIRGVGFFPSSDAPRVLWAGVQDEGIGRLASIVDGTMTDFGFPPEGRAFHPHLTLARAPRKGTIGRTVVEAAERLEETDFGSFSTRSFVLYRSYLDEAGARYAKIADFVFDPGP